MDNSEVREHLPALLADLEAETAECQRLQTELRAASAAANAAAADPEASDCAVESAAELDGLADDVRVCRECAAAAVLDVERCAAAWKAGGSAPRRRVRLRLGGEVVRETASRRLEVDAPEDEEGAAAEAYDAARRALRVLPPLRAFAKRALVRFAASGRLSAAEASLAPRVARPPVSDAAAAFANVGLPDCAAIDDALVAWEFMCAFRGSALLPALDMLPATRLDQFAEALRAPHADLQRRPLQTNAHRYLAHLHLELLKTLFLDEATDAWWPPPKRSLGPRWWESVTPPPAVNGAAHTDAAADASETPAAADDGGSATVHVPAAVPPAHNGVAHEPPPKCEQAAATHPETVSQQPERLPTTPRVDGDSPSAAAAASPDAATMVAALVAAASSDGDAAAAAPVSDGDAAAAAGGSDGEAAAAAVSDADAVAAAAGSDGEVVVAVAGAAVSGERSRPERKRKQPSLSLPHMIAEANRKRTKIGKKAAADALPLRLHDLVTYLRDDELRRAPRPPPATINAVTWATLSAAAAARLQDHDVRLRANLEAPPPPTEDDDDDDVPRIVAVAAPAASPSQMCGRPALVDAVAQIMAGAPYGGLTPAARAALLRCLVEAVLETDAARRELEVRRRAFDAAASAAVEARHRTRVEGFARCRRSASAQRVAAGFDRLANFKPPLLPAANEADDSPPPRFGEHAAAAGLESIDAGAGRLALRVALEAARDNDHIFSQPPSLAPGAADAAPRAPARAVRVFEVGETRFLDAAKAAGFDTALKALQAADATGAAALDAAIKGALRCGFASAETLADLHVAPAGVPPAAAALAARFSSGSKKKKRGKVARPRSPPPLQIADEDEDEETQPWVLRPLADAVSARHHARVRKAFAPRALHAALDAATRELPPLRAELIGQDVEGAAYWSFRAEREFNYAPHRVWVQRPPDNLGPHADAPEKSDAPSPRLPCWGYYGDLKSVAQLARSLRPEEADLERNFDIRLAA
ncbi:hypothetical protein M885DRAFT_549592 [Pelagophyceae sp. CCMP2097]|nr:hypothetical protein M885DRAFT_549592 [Pelagophyceae sp. CCMP2097]